MTSTHEPYPNGRRRIDKVLSEGYADNLADLDLDELRSRRREAEQEEADLSYVRRMLQGRMDILRAELSRRAGGGCHLRARRHAGSRSSRPPPHAAR